MKKNIASLFLRRIICVITTKSRIYICLCTELHIDVTTQYMTCVRYSKWRTRVWPLSNRDTIPSSKTTRWGEIDPWLTDDLYLHTKFKEYFDNRAAECMGGIYPTVTIRQLMWGLKMKPLKRERWETCFDRKNI